MKTGFNTTLKALALTAVFGTKSLIASSGFYLLTETPDDPPNGIAYQVNSDFRLNDNGYIQTGDEFLLGFNLQGGMPYDPHWETSRHNLRLVKQLKDNRPVTPTHMLETGFVLPLNDDIGSTHEHHWNVIDMDGKSHDVRGILQKTTEASWSLILDSHDAMTVSRDHVGGPVIDGAHPLLLSFDPATGSLMGMDGLLGGRPISFQWDVSSTASPDTTLTFDLGMAGIHFETRLEDSIFSVSHEHQDGSAPSPIKSGRFDENGIFYTIYESGDEVPSFEAAYMRLGTDSGQAVEKAPLSADQVVALNALFQ